MDQMEFEQAPRENLQTWSHVKKMVTWTSAIIAVALLIMAGALT